MSKLQETEKQVRGMMNGDFNGPDSEFLNANILNEIRTVKELASRKKSEKIRKDAAEMQKKDRERRREEQNKANEVLGKVREKALIAAEDLNDSCMIMKFSGFSSDYDGATNEQLYEDKLQGAARIVYNTLSELNLRPSLKFDHDGVGEKAWIEMWISWEDE